MEAEFLNRLQETDATTVHVYGFCRCCLIKGKHQDITKVPIENGKRENYEDIILDCFNLFLTTNSKLPNLICIICIEQLNNVRAFKEKLIETEQKLLGALSQLNGQVDLEDDHVPEKFLDSTIGVKTKVNNDTNNMNNQNTSRLLKHNTKSNDQHSFISVNNIANSNHQLPFKTVNYVANSNNQQSYLKVYVDAVIANSNKPSPLVRFNDTNLSSHCSFIGVNNVAYLNNQHTFRGVNNVANSNNQLKIIGVNSYANLNDQHPSKGNNNTNMNNTHPIILVNVDAKSSNQHKLIGVNNNANLNDHHPLKGVNNTNINNTHPFIQVKVEANSNDQHIKVNDNANSNDQDPFRGVNDDVNLNDQCSFKEEKVDTPIDLSPCIGGQADSNSNDQDPLRGVNENVSLNVQKTICENDDTVNNQHRFTKESKDVVLNTQQPDSAMEHHPVENVYHQETVVKSEIQDELEMKDELEIHDELDIKDEPVIHDELDIKDEPVIYDEQDIKDEPVVHDELDIKDEPVIHDELDIKDEPVIQDKPKVHDTIQDVLKIQDEPDLSTITETSALVGNTCNLLEYSNATLVKTKTKNGFSCFYCNKKIENFYALRQHQTEHSRSELYKILRKCKAEDLSVYAEVTNLECTICSMKMNNLKDLRAHLIKTHRLYFFQKYTDRIIPFKILRNLCFQCTICNAYSASFPAIESHLRYHITRQRIRNHDHTIKVNTRHVPKTRLQRHRPYPAPPPLKSTSENEKAVYHQETEVKPEIQDELEIHDELDIKDEPVIHDELDIIDEPVIQDEPKVQDEPEIQDEPDHITITETSGLVGNTCNLLEYSNATLVKTKTKYGFSCFYCNKKIENFYAFRQHQTEHSRSELYKILQKYKVENLSVYAEVTNLECTICSMKMNNLKDLRAHLIKTHRLYFFQKYTDRIIPFKMLHNLRFQCTICNIVLESFFAIDSHMNLHYSFVTLAKLKYHIVRQRMRNDDHTIKVETRHAPKTRHRPYPAPPPSKSTS